MTAIRSQSDIDAPTVILNTCVNDGVTDFAEARSFYEALRPLPHIQAAVDKYHRSTMAGGTVIGLHVRHGNGGNILGHARHWTSLDEGIGRLSGPSPLPVRERVPTYRYFYAPTAAKLWLQSPTQFPMCGSETRSFAIQEKASCTMTPSLTKGARMHLPK